MSKWVILFIIVGVPLGLLEADLIVMIFPQLTDKFWYIFFLLSLLNLRLNVKWE